MPEEFKLKKTEHLNNIVISAKNIITLKNAVIVMTSDPSEVASIL
jgi:hypothetical protein